MLVYHSFHNNKKCFLNTKSKDHVTLKTEAENTGINSILKYIKIENLNCNNISQYYHF